MRRLTEQQLKEVFIAPGADTVSLSTFWVILNRAKHERGIDLRDALERVRRQVFEVSIFSEKILRPEDLDDVVYVIEMLVSEMKDSDIYSMHCLRMLHAWRAKTLMQIVIDKRNADRLCDWVSENWHLAYRAHNAASLDVRVALELVRHQLSEVALIVEKILQPDDLADVECVIKMLAEEDFVNRIWDRRCLRLLQAWRARTLMQIVIEKRNAMNIKLGT